MNPMFDHTFLEQYLNDKMSPVEKEAFEIRLEKEPVLRAELAAMKRDPGLETEEGETAVAEDFSVSKETKFLPLILILIAVLLILMYILNQG